MFGAVVGSVWLNLPALGFIVLSAGSVLVLWLVGAAWDLLWGASVVILASRPSTRAGESFKVRWTIGRPRRVTEVRVTWRGREEAILRGYDKETFSEVFATHTLDPRGGPVSIDVAPTAMPSFAGKHCRIVWGLLVETRRAAGWTAEEFPVPVLPAR